MGNLAGIGQGRDEPLGVVDAVLLEDLGDNWDSRVDWVRNHKHESLGCDGGNSGGEIADDSGIDLSVAGVTKSGRRIRQFTCFSFWSRTEGTSLEEILPTCES